MCKGVVYVLFSLIFFLVSARAEQGEEFLVEETLKNAAFNTPHMPAEETWIARYGKGKKTTGRGCVYHSYFLPNLHLWLRCKANAEDRLYTPIFEILISKIDLGTRLPSKAPLTDPNLKGIRIGDDIQRAVAQWGEPLRQYPIRLGATRTTAYEFFPPTLDSGSCLRFYERNRKIMAFSFSSEE